MSGLFTTILNNIKEEFRSHETAGLDDWRQWSVNAASVLGLFLIPIAVAFSIPTYIAEKQYGMIALDMVILAIFIFKFLSKSGSYRFWMVCWIVVIYIFTITILVKYGPHFNRPTWLLFCSIMVAIFFGTRAAVVAVALNMILLLSLYYLLGPENEVWAPVYMEPFFKYRAFVVSTTVISLIPSVLVGFMLNRLDRARRSQKQTMKKLMDKNETLKQAEAEIKQTKIYLSSIIDSMPSVLVGVDYQGKVTQWNTEAERVTGLSFEASLGKPLERVFPRLVDLVGNVQKAMQTNEVFLDSRRISDMDGETRYEDVTIFPLNAEGVQGAVIRVDDVSERVRMEAMMVQSEKMMSVGGLAAGIAHEINNPLAGMMQTANVLSNRLNFEMPANDRAADEAGTTFSTIRAFMKTRNVPEMLKQISDSGKRVAGIVTNMLSFARKSEAAVSSHNVADLLDQSLDLAGSDYDLKKKYDFRRIRIIREYETDLPLIICESSKIQQVFLNILHNGAEAMNEVAGQSIANPDGAWKPQFVLRLCNEKDAGMVRIEIEDNGPGMDEKTRKRIFEPFFTTKPVGVGTGLGLSVAYGIIQSHRGRIQARNLFPGACFTIELPLHTDQEKPNDA